ncbi:golgin subfamily A member 6-like protein 25 [Drosophila kikkawai]|uniref:Golgin subfamily A member 6-like protein 25 n=1 Tax=Drosophila kikkawai TaxID=30033 RepID=A0ABM4GFR7_DROKI
MLALQEQLGMEWLEKYMNALKMRVDIEKNYKNQFQVAKTLVDLQNVELDKNQSENDHFENKCYQLDAELRVKTLECDGLNQQALGFEELMFLNNERAARIEELVATQTSLVEVNEEFARESVELNAQNNAHKETISSLMWTLDKKTQDLTKLRESQEMLEFANIQQGFLHSAERQKCEAQNLELQETIKSLQNMLKDQGQVLQAEQEKLAKVNHQKADGQSVGTKEKYEEKLKEQMNEMIALQEDLEKKDTKLIALEHQRDGIIKQLKTKMNTICSTITQPIVASTTAKSSQPTKYSKRLLRQTQPETKPAVNKPSSPAKEPNDKICIYSSDTECEADVLPLKMVFAKRENLAVVKPQNDVFDALKKGTF